jgi:hypothetical protein
MKKFIIGKRDEIINLKINDFIELSIYSPVTPKSIKDKFLVM